MTTDQTGSGKRIEQAPQYIERSILAVQRQARHSVSPWVQRALNTGVRPGTAGERSVSLSARQSQRLLERIQRRTDNSTSWRPGLGSLQPAMVSRFTNAIHDRFTSLANKHRPAANVQRQPAEDRIALLLADGVVRSEASMPETRAQTFESSGSSIPLYGPSITGTSRTIQEPSGPQVQRKLTESPSVRPAVQDVRAALERSLTARRGATTPQPTVVNPPHPSVNQVRRVARVEEIDPVSIAAQNEYDNPRMSAETAQDTPEPLAPRPTIARTIKRKLVEDANEDTVTPPAPVQLATTRVEPHLQQPAQIESEVAPPAPATAVNPPTVHRRVSNQNIQREVQPDTSGTTRDSSMSADMSPLQRMRQARSAQVQRTPPETTSIDQQPSVKIESATADHAPLGASEQAGTEAIVDQPRRPRIQRRISELPHIESHNKASAPESAPSAQEPTDQLPTRSVENPPAIQSRATEEPLAVDVMPPVIPPPSVQRSVEKETNRIDDAEKVTSAPVEMKPVDARSETNNVADQVQRKPAAVTLSEQTEHLTPSFNDSIAHSDQSIRRRTPLLEANDSSPNDPVTSETQASEVNAGAPVDVARPQPATIQRKPVESPSRFEDHTATRIQTNLHMPLTQRVRSRRQAIQRYTDQPDRFGNEPQPMQHDTSAAESQLTSPDASEAQRTVSTKRADNAPSVSDRLGGEDVASTPVSVGSDLSKPMVQRKETETPTHRTEARGLPLRTPQVQRVKGRTRGQDTGSALPAVLPQVREAAGAEMEPIIGEHQRVTGAEFSIQRSIAPVMTRTNESATRRMPLLQRKAAVEELSKRAATEPAIEIKRLVEPKTKPTLVMRKPRQSLKITKDINENVRRANGGSYGVLPGETQIIRPDINELATAIVPLIRRMLAVERERSRGL